MDTKHPKIITEEQWRDAMDAYELGYQNGSHIARELGVSASTVSREFKRRGARKACRVAETVAELEATLDAKARREARRRRIEEAAALDQLGAIDDLITDMVKSLIMAERAGNLTSAAPKVTQIGKALGVKGLR
jgi:IS30 family transposase